MDKAFRELAGSWSGDFGGSLVRVYGLQPDLLAVTYVWDPGKASLQVATKGAPEAIADLCQLDSQARNALRSETDRMA
jgi:P-type Ca2+ transporter type 2C